MPSEEGSVPESVVSCKLMYVSAVRLPSESGSVPEIRKPAMFKLVKDLSPPIVGGIVPVIPDGNCMNVSSVRRLKESGIVPDN